MISTFVVHQHKAGRRHFDLRMVYHHVLRSWSMLREPPHRPGERRLAIEREMFSAESINSDVFEEEAFGRGLVYLWDKGEVELISISPGHLILKLMGTKLTGTYDFRRMHWYPGNRWLLRMLG